MCVLSLPIFLFILEDFKCFIFRIYLLLIHLSYISNFFFNAGNCFIYLFEHPEVLFFKKKEILFVYVFI